MARRDINYCNLDQILENTFNSDENTARKILYGSKDKPTNISDRLGNTLIHMAVNDNNADKLSMFINLRCDVNLPNKHGEFPLHLAIKNNSILLIDILLNAKANTSSKCILSDFPSMKKADLINSKINLNPLNCLQLAVLLNDVDVIELISQKSCIFDITSSLNIAISIGNEKVIKLLISNGADIEKPDFQGMTPLLCAIMHNSYSITKLILKQIQSGKSCEASFSPFSASICLSKKTPYQATQIWPTLLDYGIDPNFLCYSSLFKNILEVIEMVNGKLSLQKQMGFCLFPICMIFSFEKKFVYSIVNCLKLLVKNNCRLQWNPGSHSMGTTSYKMHDSILPYIFTSGNINDLLDIIFEAGFDVSKLSSESKTYLVKYTIYNPEMTHILSFFLNNPLDLKKLCRNVIRNLLGTNIKTKIKFLNLPLRLKNFIFVF